MQKKLKIAIVMGGGWSLGAFTGGAAWELVRQLHGNRDRDRFDRCEIDVLCGAGGGALAAAVLLRTLANPDGFGPPGAVARLGEAQRAAWIEGVDFTRLMRDVAMSKPSLLDRGAIDELVLDLLAWPTGERARPVLLGRRVLLGMALLNFNGVPVRASDNSALPDAVSTTRFRDHRTFCFDLGPPEIGRRGDWRHFGGDRVWEPDTWREVAATAVASGAFPIAFEPVVLQRYREEFGPLWPEELEGRAEFPFTYGDAGAFNPQPLREAMELISAQDAQERPGSFTRALIFIDPNLSGSKHAFGLRFHLPYLVDVGNRPFARHDVVPADPAAHLVAITNRFGVLARHQGMYEDLIAAERVNARHAWRSELRTLIAELVDRLEGDASQLAARVEDRLTHALEGSRALSTFSEADVDTDDAIARVALEQTGQCKRSAELPSRDRLAFALMALMDEVAGLSGKQRVHVIVAGPTAYHPPDGSPPTAVKLAGDFFANFGGYFDPRYRVHDFDAGRALVSSALATAEPPLLADPSNRPAYKPWSDPPPSLDTAPAARDRFVRRIAELTRQLLAYKIGYMGVTQAITIVAQYVAPKLVRDSGPARRPAIVRVEVVPGTDDAEFYLAGSARGEHGGNARRLADLVVLHTVLHYSDTEVVGPHVFASADGARLRLVAQRKRGRDAFLDLTLPPPIVFQTNADAGLPIHSIRVDWPNRSASAWTEEDALRQWPGVSAS